MPLITKNLNTPLGTMIAIASEDALCLLEFSERKHLARNLDRLKKNTTFISGSNSILDSLEQEIDHYFNGNLKEFHTPLFYKASSFQMDVWKELQKIPFGKTRSYSDIAHSIKRPTAFRAVAQANGCNQLAIIIPCHRVINANGNQGGYAGGISRKEWLLKHEKMIG